MKIKMIYTRNNVVTKGYGSSFISDKYKIDYVPELDGYMIDDTVLIPIGNILEVVIEPGSHVSTYKIGSTETVIVEQESKVTKSKKVGKLVDDFLKR